MLKIRIMKAIGLLICVGCFSLSIFAQEEWDLQSVNLQGDIQTWFGNTVGNTNSLIRLEYKEGDTSPTDVIATVISSGGMKYAGLRDDGTRGDITPGDGEWVSMFPGGSSRPNYATFLIIYSPRTNDWTTYQNAFYGNNLFFPTGVTILNENSSSPSLVWEEVEGAEFYWIGVWGKDKDFLDDFGYVDISNRIAEFMVETPGVTLTGLTPGEYKWIVYAHAGKNIPTLDGGAAFGGTVTVTVTPEPSTVFLFLTGFFSLFGLKRRRNRI